MSLQSKGIKNPYYLLGGPLDRQHNGFPAFSGIARLTWLIDLFGELTFKSATLSEDLKQQYWKMTAHLHTKDNRLEIQISVV